MLLFASHWCRSTCFYFFVGTGNIPKSQLVNLTIEKSLALLIASNKTHSGKVGSYAIGNPVF